MAQRVTGDETMVMMYEDGDEIDEGLLHVDLGRLECPPSLKNATGLRSLFNFNPSANDVQLLENFPSLEVLTMTYRGGDVDFLDRLFGRLIHLNLKYLKLKSKIRYLPDSITNIVSLETLDLESCRNLKELPKDFATKLVNLKCLLLPDRELTDLPPNFSKLENLEKLNMFIVGQKNGIESLPALNLKGQLVIEFLRLPSREGGKARLNENHQLTSLILVFREEDDDPGEMNDGDMVKNLELPPNLKNLEVRYYRGDLSCLQLPRNLKNLKVSYYRGDEMPVKHLKLPPNLENLDLWYYQGDLSCLKLPRNLKNLRVSYYQGDEMPVGWLDGLSQLVSIVIFGCRECKVLPKFSGLPCLKSLELAKLWYLEYLEDGDEDRCFFPALEVVRLTECFSLKGWRRPLKDDGERCQLEFPCLLTMRVDVCPELMSMHPAPKLELLHLNEINWEMFERDVRSSGDEEAASSSSTLASLFTSLKQLEIGRVNRGLISLSITSSLCNLRVLEISECSQLKYLRFESPSSILKLLRIRMCRSLENIRGLQHLSGLRDLMIFDCGELKMEEEGKSGKVDNCCLEFVSIGGCPKVRSVPPLIQQGLVLSALKYLFIQSCPDLAGRIIIKDKKDNLSETIPNLYLCDGSIKYQKGAGIHLNCC